MIIFNRIAEFSLHFMDQSNALPEHGERWRNLASPAAAREYLASPALGVL